MGSATAALSSPGSGTGPSWVTLGVSAAIGAAGFGLAYHALRKRDDEIPGPILPFIPYVGEMIPFLRHPTKFMWDRFKWYKSLVFRSHLFGSEVVVVGDPQALRVLSDQTAVETLLPLRAVTELLGEQYFRREERHKLFRKHTMNALGAPNLKPNISHIDKVISDYVHKWIKACEDPKSKGVIRLDRQTRELFMALAMGPIAGFRWDPVTEHDLLTMAVDVQSAAFAPPIYFPGTTWYKALQTKPAYMERLQEILVKRFPPNTPGGPLVLENDKGGLPGVDTTRALLLNIFGATETTAGAALAAICATASRKDVQQKLRAEQASLVRQFGPTITWEQLSSHMPYCDSVVREVMRLMPTAQAVWRKALKTIQVGDYTISKDTLMLTSLSMFAMADWGFTGPDSDNKLPTDMDVTHWTDAFNPDRWMTPDNLPSRTMHLFGYGPHMCAGRDLAVMENKLILAHLARACTWSMPSCPKPSFAFLPYLHVTNGVPELQLVADPV